MKEYYQQVKIENQKLKEMNRNFILIIIILVLNLAGAGYLIKNEKERNALLSTTIESFKEGNKFNVDSTVVETIVKRLDLSDIKKFFPELKQELKKQGIKINALEQYQNTSLSINAEINADVKRIVNQQDTTIISKYTDKWIQFLSNYKLGDTTAKTNISMPVPIHQAIYQNRKPWLLWRFKPLVLKQKMWTDNPYAKLTYNEVIQTQR